MINSALIINILQLNYYIKNITNIEDISGYSGDKTYKVISEHDCFILKITKSKSIAFYQSYEYVSSHLENTLPKVIKTKQNTNLYGIFRRYFITLVELDVLYEYIKLK